MGIHGFTFYQGIWGIYGDPDYPAGSTGADGLFVGEAFDSNGTGHAPPDRVERWKGSCFIK